MHFFVSTCTGIKNVICADSRGFPFIKVHGFKVNTNLPSQKKSNMIMALLPDTYTSPK